MRYVKFKNDYLDTIVSVLNDIGSNEDICSYLLNPNSPGWNELEIDNLCLSHFLTYADNQKQNTCHFTENGIMYKDFDWSLSEFTKKKVVILTKQKMTARAVFFNKVMTAVQKRKFSNSSIGISIFQMLSHMHTRKNMSFFGEGGSIISN